MNPWLVMFLQPRKTIRAIVQTNADFAFWIMSTFYGLASGFFLANFYSWGTTHSFLSIVLVLLVIAPILGAAVISFDARLVSIVSFFFGGSAPLAHLRAAVVWSKIPYFLTLTFWFFLASSGPESVFILSASNDTGASIVLTTLALNLWSFVLWIGSTREVQGFSLLKAIAVILLAQMFSFVIISFLMFSFRFILINLL